MAMSMGSFATRSVATVIVAADGTGDFTEIQPAIDSLDVIGGTVYIKAGNYRITAPINITTNGILLIGSGFVSIIRTLSDISMITVNAHWVRIIDLYLDGAGVLAVNNKGIVVGARREIHITGCNISGCGDDAISLDGTTYSTINNNRINYNYKHGLAMNDVDITLVTNNQIHSNDYVNTATYDGIILTGVSELNIISNNICFGNDRYEINISAATCDRNIVTDNHCYYVGIDHVGSINDAGSNTEKGHNITI